MLLDIALKTDYGSKTRHQSYFELGSADGREPRLTFKIIATDPRFELVLIILRRLKGDPNFVDLEDGSIFSRAQLAGHKWIGALDLDSEDIAALSQTSRFQPITVKGEPVSETLIRDREKL